MRDRARKTWFYATQVYQRNSLGESACKVAVVILLAFVFLWNFSMGLANKLV